MFLSKDGKLNILQQQRSTLFVKGGINVSLSQQNHYTYADYITWEDDKRYELIDGIPYMMTPGPSRTHQKISREILKQLANFLTGKPCEVYHAPFDVRLNADKADDTVVQPDLLVVCDKSKLDDRGCNGSPDMIMEILSPSTSRHDKVLKFNKYLQAGVREYWLVNPDDKTVQVCVLENGRYVTKAYDNTDIAPVHVLAGCEIDLQEAFAD